MKKIKLNKFHFLMGILIASLVFISYFFIGGIDTSQTALEETSSVTIPFFNI